MPHPKVLARGLLLMISLLGLLAAPMAFAEPVAVRGGGAVEAQRSSTPEYSGAHVARLQAGPSRQTATNIVISEFRFSGPDGEGDEFIELYNPTAGDILIEDWSLWKTASCSDSVTPVHTFGAGVTVVAGGHYLVGTSNFSGDEDVIASTGIGIGTALNEQGGLALVGGATFDESNILDQVGTEPEPEDCPGSPAFHEGTHLAPLTDTSSYERNYGGSFGSCVDSDNNAADFTLRSGASPQNMLDAVTPCGTPTATPTNTPTNTPIDTPTATNTPVCSAIVPTTRLVLINEVAWNGTLFNTSHEWVEFYNTHATCAVNLDDWRFVGIRSGAVDFDITFAPEDIIPAGGFLIVSTNPTDDDVFQSGVSAPVKESGALTLHQNGQSLQLLGPDNQLVDTANFSPTGNLAWPAGSTTQRRSMERYRNAADTRTNWVTFDKPVPFPADWPRDAATSPAGGNLIYGSPGLANWSLSVTITPSPIPTKVRTPTPRPPTPFAHMVINEFLPRAGSDWNGDGQVNVYDEFIEIKNNGPIDGDLAGWKLDDVADGGSPAFTLPSLVLKPGERAVFYGLQTRILLDDSGDTVRLIDARGIVIDARGYGVIEKLDISHCRIPDGYYWRIACFPTPGNENALTGVVPATAPILLSAPPPCLLADTVPAPFLEAECNGFGSDVYDRLYWEPRKDPALILVERDHKWKTIYQ